MTQPGIDVSSAAASCAVPINAALEAFVGCRRDDQIVVTHQGSARLWPLLSHHPLDFNYNPSTMGGAVPFAVGIALIRPRHEVVVFTGDGSLLMNLGSLVTVVASGARNISVVVLDNGIYEVTGGQRTPAQGTSIDYAQLARGAGFVSVDQCDSSSELPSRIKSLYAAEGPRFIAVRVGPASAADLQRAGTPLEQQIRRVRQSLAVHDS